MIKRVRETTGAGILDCKRALQESGCDLAAAEDWLRKKGMAAMLKKADRAANQGMVALSLAEDGRRGAIVEVRARAAARASRQTQAARTRPTSAAKFPRPAPPPPILTSFLARPSPRRS